MRYITVKDLSFYYIREPVLKVYKGEFATLTARMAPPNLL